MLICSRSRKWVQLRGVITRFREEGVKFKKRLTAVLYDNTGQVELVWFQGIQYIRKSIQEGATYIVFGKINYFQGQPSIVHPEVELFRADIPRSTLQPIYPTTEKLRAKGLSNRSFAHLLHALWEKVKPEDVPDFLPDKIKKDYCLLNKFEALKEMHFPQNEQLQQRALYRFKWEEFFLLHLQMGQLKAGHQKQKGFVFEKSSGKFQPFFFRISSF